jgi:hypothetical protein
MREDTALADHNRSYPAGPPAVRIDGTDQLQAAARELEALVLYEQGRHLAEVYAMLAERYGATAFRSRTPSWTPRPSPWRSWSAASGSSRTWRPAFTRAASCSSWPASWAITA